MFVLGKLVSERRSKRSGNLVPIDKKYLATFSTKYRVMRKVWRGYLDSRDFFEGVSDTGSDLGGVI
jgi:hypothetical protein